MTEATATPKPPPPAVAFLRAEVAQVGSTAERVAAIDREAVEDSPPPLAASAAQPLLGATASPSEPGVAFEHMFPPAGRPGVVRLIAAAGLFALYAIIAAFGWALRTLLIRTKPLVAQARDRLRLEWLRAAETARLRPPHP